MNESKFTEQALDYIADYVALTKMKHESAKTFDCCKISLVWLRRQEKAFINDCGVAQVIPHKMQRMRMISLILLLKQMQRNG